MLPRRSLLSITRRVSWNRLIYYAGLTVAFCTPCRGLAADPPVGNAAAGATSSALPADASIERFERSVEDLRRQTQARVVSDVPTGQRALEDFGAYLTASYLSFDDQQDKNHAFRGYDLVGYSRLNLDGAHDFMLRVRGTYRDFNPGDSFEHQPDHLETHVEEAYYGFDLAAFNRSYRGRPLTDPNVRLQIGRQFQTWGEGLVLSQYLDGGSAWLETGSLTVQLLGAVTAEDLTVDFDASRPGFDRETRRAYYGAVLSTAVGRHHPYVYGLLQRDQNSDAASVIGPISTRYHYDSYYLGAGVTGSLGDRFAYGVEGVYEGGTTLSSSFDANTLLPVDQSEDDIQAFAAQLRLDYLPGDRHRSRFGVGLLVASGDGDRSNSSSTFGGNRAGTNDHAFNGLGFVADGLAFSPTFSNLVIVRGTVSAYPFPDVAALRQLQAGVEVFWFNKLQRDAAIDEPTDDGRSLGFEPDLFLNWQVTDDVTLVVRYGVFFPGSAIASEDSRQFVYAGLTYAF